MKAQNGFAPAAGGGAQAPLGPPAAGVPGGFAPQASGDPTNGDPANAGSAPRQVFSQGVTAARARDISKPKSQSRV